MSKKTAGPTAVMLGLTLLVLLAGAGPALALDYQSLYGYDHTVSYCSSRPCGDHDDCQRDAYPCSGDRPYKYSQTRQGFRATYDLHDSRIACGLEGATVDDCLATEKSLALGLGTLVQPGLDHVSSFPEGFRVFVPPGTIYGYVNLYMPIDGEEGVVVRFQQPPGFTGSYKDVSAWDVPNRITLQTLKQRDVFLRNWGGLAAALSPFYLANPLSVEDSGWLYIRKLPSTSSRIHKVSVSFRVDVASYLHWYDRAFWDAAGDPLAGETVCTADELDACDSEDRCTTSGFYWYREVNEEEERCHAEPRCRPGNLAGCESFADCRGIDAYWYDDSCHEEPACTAADLGGCDSEEKCSGSGFYWYREVDEEEARCHAEPRCRPDNPGGCEEKAACEGADAYWYDDLCHAEPACTAADLGGCDSEEKCLGAGFYWYNGACAAKPACTPSNLSDCANRQDCQANGGVWYTIGECRPPSSTGGSSGSSSGSSSSSRNVGLSALLSSVASAPRCGPDHLERCVSQSACEGTGHGYWYDNSCHAVPAQQVLDYQGKINLAPVQLGSDAGDGVIATGESFSLRVDFPDVGDFTRYVVILLSTGEYFFVQDASEQPFAPAGTMVPYRGLNHRTLLTIPNVCSQLPGYLGDWWVFALRIPAGEPVFSDLEALAAYMDNGGHYLLDYYPVRVDCHDYVPPACTADDLGTCDSEEKCRQSGFYWYEDATGTAACHAEPRCRRDNPGGCEEEAACAGIDAYWYDDSCHAQPACTVADLDGCDSEEKCRVAGFAWQDGQCTVGSGCNPANLTACTTREDCQANGGAWYTAGYCKPWPR